MAKHMEPIRKGQVSRHVRFGQCALHCNMFIFICDPMKLKKYQVDLPARIFKKFARGETELSLSYVFKKLFRATSDFQFS